MANTDENPRRLVASSVSGRYALDTASGPDLHSNTRVALVFGDSLVTGEIQHGSRGYLCARGVVTGEYGGYYFLADNGQVFGLRIGMLVRRIEEGEEP